MLIALDFDGTFCRWPGLWSRFIADVRACGGRVVIVSCRKCECNPDDGVCENHRDLFDATGIAAHLTSGAPKRWFMEQRGIKVDIWVDDDPMTIEYGR